MDRAKAREQGRTLTIAVLVLVFAIMYVAHVFLSRWVGAELSFWVLLTLGVFAIHAVFECVPGLYERWVSHRVRD